MTSQHQVGPARVVALDLDDTLLRSDGTISPRTVDLLRAWRAAGNYVVIATGRPPRNIAEALPDDFHQVPWITYNGAVVFENGVKIYENLMSVEDTQQIVALVLDALPSCTLGLEIENVLYLNQAAKRPIVHRVANLHEVATTPSAKVLFWHTDFASLDPLLTGLPPSARALLSDKYSLVQILAASADKAEALRFVVERWQLDMGQVVAFGDDVNDIEMVRCAGLGVAVENAIPAVKAVANRVTRSNDEDGVALVLAELLRQI
jgi:HAD superfamily hydrolase (TIGR01484 family)